MRATPEAMSAPAVVSRRPLPAPPSTGDDAVTIVVSGVAAVPVKGTVVGGGSVVARGTVLVARRVDVVVAGSVVVDEGTVEVVVVVDVVVEDVGGVVAGGFPPLAASTSALNEPAT